MSRDVRRVPLDFDYPLGGTWQPYQRPASLALPKCPTCHGTGSNAAYEWLYQLMYRLGMAAHDVLVDQPRGKPMHPWLVEGPNLPTFRVTRPVTDAERIAAQQEIERSEALGEAAHHLLYSAVEPGSTTLIGYDVVRPDEALAELVIALSGEPRDRLASPFSGGSTTAYAMANAVAAVAGLDPETWHKCRACNGEGNVGTVEQRAAADAWEPTEPPTGEGWQLWQTVSEGGPISPVFSTPEELVTWLVEEYPHTKYGHPMNRAQAEAFVDVGSSAGSFVQVGDGPLIPGETAFAPAD